LFGAGFAGIAERDVEQVIGGLDTSGASAFGDRFSEIENFHREFGQLSETQNGRTAPSRYGV
jgi:hypothetical protein